MRSIIANWKSTASGVATILTAIGTILTAVATGAEIPWSAVVPAIITGVGLIFVRDSDVSTEESR